MRSDKSVKADKMIEEMTELDVAKILAEEENSIRAQGFVRVRKNRVAAEEQQSIERDRTIPKTVQREVWRRDRGCCITNLRDR